MTATRTEGAAPTRQADPPAPRRPHRTWFPYLILLPAVLLELLIHIVPMATGFWMSFVELTKFFIRRWTEAPFAGLENYRIAVDLNTPIGQELLNSFLVTVGFTVLVVGLLAGAPIVVGLALVAPLVGALLWGRQWVAGIVAGYMAVFVALPTLVGAVSLLVSRAVDAMLVRLPGQRHRYEGTPYTGGM